MFQNYVLTLLKVGLNVRRDHRILFLAFEAGYVKPLESSVYG